MMTSSKFEDKVWAAPKNRLKERSISFDGVWSRNPRMRDTARAFIWAKLNGLNGCKVAVWGTGVQIWNRLTVVATALETDGLDCFSKVTPRWVEQYWMNSIQNQQSKDQVAALLQLLRTEKMPHLPIKNPLRSLDVRDYVVLKQTKKTTPLSSSWFLTIVRRALEYEGRIPLLKKLEKTRKWDSATAVKLGVTGIADLNREIRLCKTAGLICILAATGMRRSELISLDVGSLKCLQRTVKPLWVLWGTVYKFHGRGARARWICGQLGRRGYEMLVKLSNSTCLLPALDGTPMQRGRVTDWLRSWIVAQNFGPDAPMGLRPHMFRHTVANLLFWGGGVTTLGIKEQFKHVTPVMSDYYVASNGQMYASFIREDESPEFQSSRRYQLETLKEMNKEEEE